MYRRRRQSSRGAPGCEKLCTTVCVWCPCLGVWTPTLAVVVTAFSVVTDSTGCDEVARGAGGGIKAWRRRDGRLGETVGACVVCTFGACVYPWCAARALLSPILIFLPTGALNIITGTTV